ncbi:hypothetical protein HOLleu_27287 [Holothuria leucospilota]|uniref:Uncharacterized protein n=1 Tax=Holothuria leucospilota TaxID=206669 RepID=A0A9Q1BQ32_HOLLE|nr:hypothetical protein HOLleu_27287 [Holothuria leucospilota]
MSKAFDNVDRGKRIKDLKVILKDNELHILAALVKDVKLRVRLGNTLVRTFTTNTVLKFPKETV